MGEEIAVSYRERKCVGRLVGEAGQGDPPRIRAVLREDVFQRCIQDSDIRAMGAPETSQPAARLSGIEMSAFGATVRG
ncbi:hypothetical protein [Muricoccus pecuniae]|uniref:Uncharacterized protein n=1 Tax=Muricoccus pecuniae TaxID=693023 RepID=A0A840Y0R7_9PROT|nr:hypothetical protein [Roseomonas pecuniae]MBB5694708.1 hypothetical protein [Roseomonas pecuniae]